MKNFLLDFRVTFLSLIMIVLSPNAYAVQLIDSEHAYAWNEKIGWISLQQTEAQLQVYTDHLEGYIWSDSIGWIDIGSEHSAKNNHTYANTSADNWGINIDTSGHLSGYAWNEQIGWIDFSSADTQVSIDLSTGFFSGYAWNSQIGWISFSGDNYMVKLTNSEISGEPLVTITGTSTGVATEDSSTQITGSLSIADENTSEAVFVAQTNTAGTYGGFNLATSGGWTYDLDNANGTVQALINGATLTDSFTATSLDSTGSQLVTITITGVNGVATITGTSTGAATEDNSTQVVGSLSITDEDTGEAVFVAQTDTVGIYGMFTIDSDGKWTFDLDNFNTFVQEMSLGEQLTDDFLVWSLDGTGSQVVSVTTHGVNDVPNAEDDELTLDASVNDVYIIDVLANDSDSDGDVLSIIGANTSIGTVSTDGAKLTFITQAGFVGQVILTYTITDGNNAFAEASVIVKIVGALSETAPVITLPEDVIVNATGLFTKVDLGVATAVDSTGQILPVSLVDGTTIFRPGNNVVYWQAEDSQGLKSVASQSVVVHPLITMGQDKTSVEGTSHNVGIYLSGTAPIYPVTIGYSVSGSADSNDHNLVSGEIVIASGEMGTISFDVLADDLAEENKTLTITLDDTLNLGAKSAYTLTITEQNIAPQVTYSVTQDNEQRLLIDNNAGQVVIQTEVSDSNALDTHQYQWLDSDSELVDIDSDEATYTFDSTGLTAGIQTLNLVVTDNGDTPLSTTTNIYLVIADALVVLTEVDSDGDLIPDNEEGLGDDDFDGIPNYLDVPSACNVMPQQVSESQGFLVEGESGVCLRKGATVADNKSGGLELSPDEIQNDEGTLNVGGIFDFIVYGLPQAGQNYNLVLPLRLPIPADASYRKFTPTNGWVEFVVDVNNQLASSQGSFGFCPPPGDASWTIGLNEDHWCVQLTIEDGGPNDDDGLANGSIVDPGGVGVFLTANKSPVAADDVVDMVVNNEQYIDVLINDTDEDSGDVLVITSATTEVGTVSIIDNRLYYVSANNYVGDITINYGISDNNGGSDHAVVTINMIWNKPPVVSDENSEMSQGESITLNLLANATDPDGDVLSLIAVDNADVSFNDEGQATYTPAANFYGNVVISYTVQDSLGNTAAGQWDISVTEVFEISYTTTKGG